MVAIAFWSRLLSILWFPQETVEVFCPHALNSSAASMAVTCQRWPVTLFQRSSQIHGDEESRLFPKSEKTGSYIRSVIFQALLWELLQEAQFPKRDVCHAPGDCGNWSLVVCKEIGVLRIKNLSLNPISIVSDMICYIIFVIISTLEMTVEGRFMGKVTVSSRRVEDQSIQPLYYVANKRSQGRT